ncbi:hypothetical protein K435DRAFT_900572 [Dendrothele bispora CBS 962.96]|uniref:Uncharacterized protein n=1 Tax=Dendrothele bispora (strain CBS 962.96) TaxID=1314807 RepID=A0A4S8LXS8_DENBC|nr:hypothetical protein K435DRAFT_900572 [Dendrothele bispora CBS 962.96]
MPDVPEDEPTLQPFSNPENGQQNYVFRVNTLNINSSFSTPHPNHTSFLSEPLLFHTETGLSSYSEPRRPRGRPKTTTNVPLADPRLPSVPLNTENYTLQSQLREYPPLLPPFTPPSPITPSLSSQHHVNYSNHRVPLISSSPFIGTPVPVDSTESDELNISHEIPIPTTIIPPSVHMPAKHSLPTPPHSITTSEFSHSLPNFRSPRMSREEKLDKAMDYLLNQLQYNSIAEFISVYFQQIPRGSMDIFTARHKLSLRAFLQGQTQVKPVHLVELMFNHRYSFPSHKCADKEFHRQTAYSTSIVPASIKYARCSISSWATQMIGKHVHREMENAIYPSITPDNPDGTPIISHHSCSTCSIC